MFGFVKSPINKVFKQNWADVGKTTPPTHARFEHGVDEKNPLDRSRRTSSEPNIFTADFNSGEGTGTCPSASGMELKHGAGFYNTGGLEGRSVQDLESYAVHRAEETTETVGNCLRIAEDIRNGASNTLVVLQQQGEQISRTHLTAADMDRGLTQGEKILGGLGGMFSRTWKPKKTRKIKGPVISNDGQIATSENTKEKRKQMGLAEVPKKPLSGTRTPPCGPADALVKVDVERGKQDEGLSDLSNIIGDLKNMAFDMGNELDIQNKGLDHLHEDVDEVNRRLKGANRRARHLLGN